MSIYNLKINAIDKSVFNSADVTDMTVTAKDGTTASRREIVALSRLLACEYAGKQIASRPGFEGSFASYLVNGERYSDLAKTASDKTLLFAAGIANSAVGREAPASIAEVKGNLSYAKDANFLRTLAAIASDVLSPIFYDIISDVAMGGLMAWEPIPFGGVKEITLESNDIFVFEDSALGSARSASFNALYDKTLTLNPHPYTAQAKAKWYQIAVNGDIGAYYNAIIRGMWNKIYAIFMEKLIASTSDTTKIPSALKASTYTSDNWATITTLVAAANGVKRENLLAYGMIKPLSRVLPVDGLGAAMTGLQYGLGEEWFKQGFLPNAAGVQLLEVNPAIVPHTQNSTLDTIGLGTNIFITAKAGYGYAPIYAGYYEGSPMTIEMTPDITGDLTIDITATAMFDTKAVFGSKVGVLTNIT